MAKSLINSKLTHRGRFQAQGLGLEKSTSWSQNTGLTERDGNLLLTELKQKLTASEFSERSLGFYECSIFIKQVSQKGGCGPTSKHFPKLSRPKGKRVDLEVKAGMAFV